MFPPKQWEWIFHTVLLQALTRIHPLTQSPTHPGTVRLPGRRRRQRYEVNGAKQKDDKSQKVRYEVLSPLSLRSCHLVHGHLGQWCEISNSSRDSCVSLSSKLQRGRLLG